MVEGLYSAAAGMMAQQERLDSVANDIANAIWAVHLNLGIDSATFSVS